MSHDQSRRACEHPRAYTWCMVARARRTWFRFSLRSLFALVTIASVWLGYQMSIVRERQTLRSSIVAGGGVVTETDPSAARMPDIEDAPWYRRILGDRAVASIQLATNATPTPDVRHVLRAFPEAEVWGKDASGMPMVRMRDLTGRLHMVNPPLADPR